MIFCGKDYWSVVFDMIFIVLKWCCFENDYINVNDIYFVDFSTGC